MGEWVLRACDGAYGLRTLSLRYFNVAGAATPELGDVGVFNLVPMVFERLEERIPQVVQKESLDQLAHGLAAAAVRQRDVRVFDLWLPSPRPLDPLE